MFLLRVLSIILAVSIFYNAFSQQLFVTTNYSVAEGLPSAETYEVFQDSKGFIWIATDNGVCRFDGQELEVFNIKDGLNDPVVFGIFEDYKGRVWFRTYSGKIAYFENEMIHSYKYNDILTQICRNQIMYSLHCDSLNRIWFGIGPFIGKIDNDGTIDTIKVQNKTVALKTVENKNLISFHGPSIRLNQLLFQNKIYPFKLTNKGQRGYYVRNALWNKKHYLTIDNFILEFDGQTLKTVLSGKAPIISLSVDRENNLWVCYMNKGAERYKRNFDLPDLVLFEDKSVTNVILDHEGGLWLSTLENGVYYVPNLSIQNLQVSTPLKAKAIFYTPNIIFTGDISGKINAFDSETGKLVWERKFEDPILAIFRTKKGDLWISTTTAISIFDSLFNLKNNMSESRIDFLETDDKKIWAINTSTVAIFNETGERLLLKPSKTMLRSVSISDSKIFLVGRYGFHIQDQNHNILEEPASFKNLKILQIADLNDSTLIVATVGNGVIFLNKKDWNQKQFNSSSTFNADNIYSFLTTDSLLWMGTDKGIAVSNLKSILNGKMIFNFLTTKSGLISNKVNFLAPGKNALWAFSDNGVSLIPYLGARFANKKPLFFLSQITVNGNNFYGSSNLNLANNENNVLIGYRCISFNNPYILIRYRLSADESWVINRNRNILLSSMAPGNYKFELEYSSDNIHWETAIAPLTFTIRRPWWNMWYVQVLAFAIFTILAYLYFKHQRSIYNQKNNYLKIINEHQQKLIQSEVAAVERERNRMAKELHDRVGTNLTAIKLIVSQILKNHKEPFANDIEGQFQLAIGELKEIIYGLTPPSLERYGLFTGLKNYIGKLNKNIPILISLKTYGTDVYKHELSIIIFRVLQELITNSIKHSFARHITIHMNSFEDVLNIVYEDDGVGFSYDPLQSGLGLDSIESRINSIAGTLKFESGNFGISYTIDIPVTINKEEV